MPGLAAALVLFATAACRQGDQARGGVEPPAAVSQPHPASANAAVDDGAPSEMTISETVESGKPFKVEGDGWIHGNVTLEIKQGDTPIWSRHIVPDHGEFSVEITLPLTADVPSKDTWLYIRDDQSSRSVQVKVTGGANR